MRRASGQDGRPDLLHRGDATEDEVEDLQVIDTEVIADFTDSFLIEDRFVRVADSAEPLQTLANGSTYSAASRPWRADPAASAFA